MILNKRVSVFSSTREIIVDRTDTIENLLQDIKVGKYKKQVERVRAGDSEEKKNLPTVAFHGMFKSQRKKNEFIEASGLVILDLDNVEDDLQEVKEDIMEMSDNVLAVMISPSGNGIKILYYVEPDLVNADNYRQIGKKIVTEFEIYGHVDFLSTTDCLIVTYDPDIIINPDAVPAYVFVKPEIEEEVELEKLNPDMELWTDAEDFFDTVLANDIAEKTNNNFHFIQVAILDLAKFGFFHPKEDLSFVIDYAESNFKYSATNKQRFQEVTELAKSYKQSQWPYKLNTHFNDEEEEDDYIDYSEYITPEPKEKGVHKNENSAEGETEETEEEGDGMVDYETFFDSVVEVVKEGDRVGYEISYKNFADIFRFKGSGILTITGIPGHGKTEMVDACIVDLARLHGQSTYIVGFEQTPQEHTIKLIRRMVGTNVTCPSWFNEKNQPEFKRAFDYITDKIKHVDTTKVGGNIIEILRILAKKISEDRVAGKDPKYVVIDPFNMLSIKGRLSGHEKIEEILRRITHFSHQMGVLVILVAHPFKMKKDEKTGSYEVPDFYSVKGSSAFFEMSYHGLVVYRTGYQASSVVLVRVLKVKQNNLGTTGEEVNFIYDKNSGRYIPVDEEGNEEAGDHRKRDWLSKALERELEKVKELETIK